ncbi:uncharacterized protein LOC130745105 [Lotus japonicus]|uniref:uncharacterized protein LOC130745105 n=1 Tax=Lotus japonicus TaxID=34305 RepID=UPI0025845157|nr:uncharacterized protein LOC130745105 [Lotus japonicus]
MEGLEQSQEELRSEVNQMKEQMEKILEAVQALGRRESTEGIPSSGVGDHVTTPAYPPGFEPQPLIITPQGVMFRSALPHNSNISSQAASQSFMPFYGIPQNYTSTVDPNPLLGFASEIGTNSGNPTANLQNITQPQDHAYTTLEGSTVMTTAPVSHPHHATPAHGQPQTTLHLQASLENPVPPPSVYAHAPHIQTVVEEALTGLTKDASKGQFAMLEESEADLCLVPDIVIPPKFKVPEFDRYKGTTCPKNHLTMYCRKMASYAYDDKLLIHFFQDSLSGAASSWYTQLERSHIRSWKDLADAFLKQYKFNLDMAPDRIHLQNMLKKGNETFKEYAQRWREIAAQVYPPVTDKEMITMFVETLQPPFYDHMVGSVSSNFADMVTVGERVESGMRTGRIAQASGGIPSTRKPTYNGGRKKEGEAHVVGFAGQDRQANNVHYSPRAQPQYQTVANIPPSTTQAPPSAPAHPRQNFRPNQGSWSNTNQRSGERRRFDPMPKTYSELLPHLISNSLVVPTPLRPVEPPYPKWYDPNAKCDYHAGAIGHSTENCWPLKHKVQALIDAKWLTFTEEADPNIKKNPLPNHGEQSTNAIEESLGQEMVENVDEVKTPMGVIFVEMCKYGMISGSLDKKEMCGLHPGSHHLIQDCEEFKLVLQNLMDEKLVQVCRAVNNGDVCAIDEQAPPFRKPLVIPYVKTGPVSTPTIPTPLMIRMPTPFPYKDNKAVSWKYDLEVYPNNSQLKISGRDTPVVTNISGIGRMTRSGRIYGRPEDDKDKPKEAPVSEKGKEKTGGEAANEKIEEIAQESKPVSDEEVCELLKFIKQSEYAVVDQLNRIPAKISLLALLMNSDPHRKALLKVLNEAHVTQDISVGRFEGIVGNITANNFLAYSDAEIPSEGITHNKALYISLKCMDHIMAKALVDNGSSVNVLPKPTFDRLPAGRLQMRPSPMIVKAFDGTRREVLGEIDLPVLVGPVTFIMTFQVMDMVPAYSCLLGRPWMHPAKALPSTLHQKIKFIVDDKLVIVSAEEDMLISKPITAPYIEAAEGAVEASFQSLEIANATYVKEKAPILRTELSGASPAAKMMIEKGYQYGCGLGKEGQGRTNLVEIPINKDRSGLGALDSLFLSQVAMAAEEAPGNERVDLVLPCEPDSELDNWEILELPVVLSPDSKYESDSLDGDSASPLSHDFDRPVNQADEVEEDEWEPSPDLLRLVDEEDRKIEPHEEPMEVINLGSEENKKEVKIGTCIKGDARGKLVSLLFEYVDVFAWSYQDMPGLDPAIVVHKLPMKPECSPVKQKLRRMKPEMSLKIREEVKKQFDAGFLAVSKYPQWVANIVPVPKKNGQVRMYVDYRDLNRASPKDDFPLPHIDVLVDNTAHHSFFSFMDGFSGYNQIRMAPEDMEKTTFITLWGTFCYKVMSFGLKNAGATYQRAMVTLFHDLMHKEIEVYVDDIIAKSTTEEEHIANLHKLFERLRKFKLRLNPAKCTFGVKSGKLLGFIVSQKGIEVDPDKVRAIQEMPAPRTEKEVRGFLGRLNYIARFISQLTATCEPIFKLMRKNQSMEWNDDCQRAFEKIKQYLQNPPVLVPPVPGRPLIIYLTVLEGSMGCVLGQHDESGRKEQAIYYLSKKFTDCEARYSLLERTCCALAWAARRLRQYMLSHTTWLVSKMDPIKYIFEKPALTGRIARWQMLLSEYDILYVTQKSVKGSALADFLAHQPLNDYQSMQCEFPDEDIMALFEEGETSRDGKWVLFFDGASNMLGHGIGAVLISPEKQYIPITARLCFDCTNNIAEYEACAMGLQAALETKIRNLEVYGDSALVIHQLKGEWETRDAKLIPYQSYIRELMEEFDEVNLHHIPREDNQLADALATLSSMFEVSQDGEMPLIKTQNHDKPAYCQVVEGEPDGKPWYYDIKKYIKCKEYPSVATENDKRTLRRLATSFFLNGDVLYKKNLDLVLLRCVDATEAQRIIDEIHEGSFGTHMNGHTMAKKILRAGYYWLTMETDCCNHVKKCYKCQVYADNINASPVSLNVMTTPWPFSMWGIDVIGPIEPKASNGHRFILVAIDYFTKWVEASSYASVTKNVVVRFIKKELICRYGLPSKIITDNGTNLNNKMMKELCDDFKIQHHNSTPYRPKMNGAVEAANKNIKKIVQKMVVTYKDWHDMLPFALHGYRTSVRTSTGATPFSLVYGMEAVLPFEVEIPSLRVIKEAELEEAEWIQARFEQLNLIEGKRLNALCHGQLYQKRMKKAFDKRVRPRELQEGDLVLKKILPIHKDSRGKWTPNYEGPYVVKKAFSGGALILTNMDGDELPHPVNSDSVKKYYA